MICPNCNLLLICINGWLEDINIKEFEEGRINLYICSSCGFKTWADVK